MVSATDPYGRILGSLDRTHYFFFRLAPHSHSRGSVNSVPDPLHLRKSGSAGTRTRTSGSVATRPECFEIFLELSLLVTRREIAPFA
jgi:hypothetical protein